MSLQKLRLEKGLSQSQLSKVTGINVRTIQHYEINSKDINGARLDKLVRLAITLNCSITDLLTDEKLIEECKKTKL